MADARFDVLADLRERITTGKIRPGSHLTEATLAAEYQLSRTPIRGALRSLASEGLIVIEPNRGAFVAEWTNEDAREVMEIRSMLEAHGAALAATKRTQQQLDRLTELCDDMDQLERDRPKDFRARIADLNHDLHLLILEAAAAPRLFNIGKDLALAPIMSGSFQYYSDVELRRSLQDHRLILDAISAADSARARALMECHLRTSYATLSHAHNT